MKTTVEIRDELLEGARELARRTRRPLRAVIEDGLRQVLAVAEAPATYKLPDLSVGDAAVPDPMESLSWQDLRDEIYGEPRSE